MAKDQEVIEGMTDMADVEKELEEVERKMSELEKEREDRSKRIMDRRVLQVTTLQELGKKSIIFHFILPLVLKRLLKL